MIVFNRFKPFGFQFGLVSKRLKRTVFAMTVGRINQANDLSRYSFGIGWNLRGLSPYQIYWRK